MIGIKVLPNGELEKKKEKRKVIDPFKGIDLHKLRGYFIPKFVYIYISTIK